MSTTLGAAIDEHAPLQFPLHKVSVVPGGIKYEIQLDIILSITLTMSDEQFLLMAQLLKKRRQEEAAARLTIAHALPKGMKPL